MKEFLNMCQNLNKDNLHLLGAIYSENVQFIDPAHEINGLENMVENLLIPLSKENITVSLICPGFVKIRLTDLNVFPKRFTYILKLLSCLPRLIWNKIAEQMVKK